MSIDLLHSSHVVHVHVCGYLACWPAILVSAAHQHHDKTHSAQVRKPTGHTQYDESAISGIPANTRTYASIWHVHVYRV